MAVLTVHTADRAGTMGDMVANQVACAGGGDSFPNTGSQFVVITNGSGAPITLSEVIQAAIDGQTPSPRTVSLAAGKTYILGPYPIATYNDGNARMNFTYSGVTSLTIGVFQLTTQ